MWIVVVLLIGIHDSFLTRVSMSPWSRWVRIVSEARSNVDKRESGTEYIEGKSKPLPFL